MIFLLLGSSGSHGPVGAVPQSQSRAGMSGASLGSAGESRARAAAQPWMEHEAVLLPRGWGWGWGQGSCCEPSEAIRLLLLLENQMCKQSGRAFTFHGCDDNDDFRAEILGSDGKLPDQPGPEFRP